MALSSFIANCFKYLVKLVKWSPYVFLKFCMKILNLLSIIDKKHPLCVFFETSKSWNCWPFYPTGTMSRTHTFEKCQCDRCQHRSAVKNTPPPSLSFPVPIPPPHRTHHPSVKCPGPMISGPLDPVTSSANGVVSLAHSIGIRSFPFHAPPPSCPVPAKPALPVEKKVSHSRKG